MKILFLTQWFEPEATLKGLKFAKELVSRGHEVHVLTGFPNYPGGKVYPGYKIRLWDYEVMDGIPVHRVALYPSHDKSAIGRVFNYVSFSLSAAFLGPFLVPKVDVVYVYHPPATVGLPAMVLKFLRRVPFVYDIQDFWPDTLAVTGMFNSQLGLKIIGKWCDLIYRSASKIVVLSPGFKEKLVGLRVPRDKVEVIYNWTNEETVVSADRDAALARELGMTDRFNVVFAGNMGLGQALDAVLDAAEMLKETEPKIQFVFLGGGVDEPRLRTRALEMKLDNVRFLPRRPLSKMPELLALADVLLVHLKDEPLFSITIPSKTQAYLYAGKPILMAVRGDAARLVEDAGAGIACEPEDSDEIAETIHKMFRMQPEQLAQMGQNGKLYYEVDLSFQVGAGRFENAFRGLTQK